MSTIAPPAPQADAPAEETKGGRGKLLLILVALLLVGGGAGWWFFLRPTEPPKPVPGEVMPLEPIQVNLADGHYLRIGIALQLEAEAHEVDGSKALDTVIELFSGVDTAELAKPSHREELKHELSKELEHAYHGDVMEVYFTEFVTQ